MIITKILSSVKDFAYIFIMIKKNVQSKVQMENCRIEPSYSDLLSVNFRYFTSLNRLLVEVTRNQKNLIVTNEIFIFLQSCVYFIKSMDVSKFITLSINIYKVIPYNEYILTMVLPKCKF